MEEKPIRDMSALADAMRADIRGLRAGKRNTIIVGVILLIVVLGYISWIHGHLQTWLEDEKQVATLMAGYARERVPMLEQQAGQAMVNYAPQAVDAAADAAIKAMPDLRKQLAQRAEDGIKQAISEVEGMLEAELEPIKARVKETVADLPDAEKRQGFEEQVQKEVKALYEESAAADVREVRRQMEEFADAFESFTEADPATLTEGQRQRRKLLLMFIATMEKYRAGEGTGLVNALDWAAGHALETHQEALEEAIDETMGEQEE